MQSLESFELQQPAPTESSLHLELTPPSPPSHSLSFELLRFSVNDLQTNTTRTLTKIALRPTSATTRHALPSTSILLIR